MSCRAVCLALLLSAPGWSRAVEPSPPPDAWRPVFRELAEGDYTTRSAAADRLFRQGTKSIPWLLYTIEHGDAESVARSYAILDRMLASDSEEVSLAAEEVLYALIDARDPKTLRDAQEVIHANAALLQKRGIEKLRSFGAKIDYGPDLIAMAMEYNVSKADPEWIADTQLGLGRTISEGILVIRSKINEGYQDPKRRAQVPSRPEQIFITSRWKGGESGARYLRRFQNAGHIGITVTKGSHVPSEAIFRETSHLSNVNVIERGPSLGVRANTSFGCWIQEVLRGGAAAKAGVQPGDRILSIDGKRVELFEQLIAEIHKHQVNDPIELLVERNGEIVKLKAILGDWSDTETSNILWDPEIRRELRQFRVGVWPPR